MQRADAIHLRIDDDHRFEQRKGQADLDDGTDHADLVLAGTQLGDCRNIALLSGGTDGEDGPTDAAGAFVTEEVAQAAKEQNLDAADHLRRNDAYEFFRHAGGLFITGPTQTNVCDLRVIAISGRSDEIGRKF